MRKTQSLRCAPLHTSPSLLLALLIGLTLLVGGCGLGEVGAPDETQDDGFLDEQGWLANDPGSERQTLATCPNGGKVTPKAPIFKAAIDGYASYVGQSTCSGTSKPGVVAFQKLIQATYPCTASYGIVRGCSVGGTSEHKEGRAWDWGLNYPHQAATSLLAWLTATDSFGNKHAMARRFGIMYMVWNRKIWKSYQASKGWQSYTGSNPHTDHVHFSFSWAGANKQTSFWNPPAQPAPNKAPRGWLDKANCTSIAGWAQDQDVANSAIKVRITIGTSNYTVTAGDHRADLCTAIGSCKHGFSRSTPSAFKDGKAHKVYVYGLDSKTGAKTQLSGSPKTITCAPPPAPAPPPPPPPPPAADPPPPPAAAPDSGPGSSDAGVPGSAIDPTLAPDSGVESDALAPPSPDEIAAPPSGQPQQDRPGMLIGDGCSIASTTGALASTAPWTFALLLLIAFRARRRYPRR